MNEKQFLRSWWWRVEGCGACLPHWVAFLSGSRVASAKECSGVSGLRLLQPTRPYMVLKAVLCRHACLRSRDVHLTLWLEVQVKFCTCCHESSRCSGHPYMLATIICKKSICQTRTKGSPAYCLLSVGGRLGTVHQHHTPLGGVWIHGKA